MNQYTTSTRPAAARQGFISKHTKATVYQCERCGFKRVTRIEEPFCSYCEARIGAEETRTLEAKEKAWGERHKCRRCEKPLPLNKYFNCDRCAHLAEKEEDPECYTVHTYVGSDC